MATVKPMNEMTKDKINIIFNKMSDTLGNLYGRWLDERKYEDFKDYSNLIKETFNKIKSENYANNAFFVKANKRPFGFTFDFEGWQIIIGIKGKTYSWKAKLLIKPQ
jgi:hypothetical protein